MNHGNRVGFTTVGGHVVQAGEVQGGLHVHSPAPVSLPAPCELPPPPRLMVDRAAETAWLAGVVEAAANGGERVVVIDGPPGIGKTALVTNVLVQAAARFAGGALYEDLGAAGMPAEDAGAHVVLARWLRAVGVPVELIPSDPYGLLGLWRTETRRRPVAVLAENLTDWTLVRSLRPARGLLVVTSRRRMEALAALDDADLLTVGGLDATAAAELIAQIIARRTPANPSRGTAAAQPDTTRPMEAPPLRVEDVRGLAVRSGGVPLAARLIAGQLVAGRGGRALTAAELAERISRIQVGETMTEHFTAALAALSESAREGFSLLGLHPAGHPLGVGVAGTLLDVGEADARRVLDELVEHNLLNVHTRPDRPGRYVFHDLAYEHARGLAAELPESVRIRAIARMGSWYAVWAGAAERVRTPHRRLLGWRGNVGRELTGAFTGAAEALAWLDAEQATISAVQQLAREWDLHDVALELGEVLWGWLQARRAHPQWEDICLTSIGAARQMRDPAREGRMTCLYAGGLRDAGRQDAAAEAAEDALRLAVRAGDDLGRASAHEIHAHLWLDAGRHTEALSECLRALQAYDRFGHDGLYRARGLILRLMGDIYTASGQGSRAVDTHGRALDQFTRLGDVYQIGRTQIANSEAHRVMGDCAEAVRAARKAVEILTPLGVEITLGHAHIALAEALADTGDSADIARARESAADAQAAYGTGLREDHPGIRRVHALADRLDGLDQ